MDPERELQRLVAMVISALAKSIYDAHVLFWHCDWQLAALAQCFKLRIRVKFEIRSL